MISTKININIENYSTDILYKCELISEKDFQMDERLFTILSYYVNKAEASNARIGKPKTKTRGEVRGGGRKCRKQKHTGFARMGSSRVPHRKGGGVAFGPNNRTYKEKINKKLRQKLLTFCLFNNYINYKIFDDDLSKYKTKNLRNIITNNSIFIYNRDEYIKSISNFKNITLMSFDKLFCKPFTNNKKKIYLTFNSLSNLCLMLGVKLIKL
jgi:50S ribosomal protein L4